MMLHLRPNSLEDRFSSLDFETLLAIHAILRKRATIPRLFLSNDILYHMTPGTLLRTAAPCLTHSIESIELATCRLATEAGICPLLIDRLDQRAQTNLTKAIEDLIESRCGPGVLHYEYARFTPFTREDIAARLLQYENWRDEENLLVQHLIARTTQKVQCIQEYMRLATERQMSETFDSVYKAKVDTLWQNTWLSHTRYIVPSNDERMIRSLVLTTFERPCAHASSISVPSYSNNPSQLSTAILYTMP